MAITAPSIKVIDYALSGGGKTEPSKTAVYGISILSGLLIPFGILFLRFSLDTKVHTRKDLEKIIPELPIVAEIPYIPQAMGNKKSVPSSGKVSAS